MTCCIVYDCITYIYANMYIVINKVPSTFEPLKMALKGPKHVRPYKHYFICIKLVYMRRFVIPSFTKPFR